MPEPWASEHVPSTQVVLVTGFAATATIMFKRQLALSRLNCESEPCTSTHDLPDAAGARLWNFTTVLHTQRSVFLCVVCPPPGLSHMILGERGLLQTPEHPYLMLRHFFPVQVSQTIQRLVVVGDLLLQ